ncbi:MAG: hypothetical protein C5B53_09590 [Candidatus Melainabacteria bacterium]|nr:MAG: hypothetical protein C5B53_09590 [Candidatus Melainabacteria bacterium]
MRVRQVAINRYTANSMKKHNRRFPNSNIFWAAALSASFVTPAFSAGDWEELVDSTDQALLKQQFREAELKSLEVVRVARERQFPLPKLLKGLSCLGEAYAGQGKWKLAEDAFKQAIAVHSKIPDTIRLHADLANMKAELAEVYTAENDWPRAEKEWESARKFWQEAMPITTEPMVVATVKLAQIYLAEGNYADAIESAGLAEKMSASLKSPESYKVATQTVLACAYAKRGQSKEAEGHFRQALAAAKRSDNGQLRDTTPVVLSYADYLSSCGRLNEALSALRQLENSLPVCFQADRLFAIAQIYRQQHQYRQAASYYERAANLYSSSNASRKMVVGALIAAATMSYSAHDLPWSARICDEVIPMMGATYGSDNFQTASILCHAGNVYKTLAQFDRADILYKRALGAELRMPMPRPSVGNERIGRNVIGLLTNTADAIVQLSVSTKHAEKTYTFFEEQLKVCPNDCLERRLLKRLITWKLGELAARLGKLDESVAFCQLVVQQQENDILPGIDLPRVLETMASVYMRQQKYKLANEALSRAKLLRASKA